MNDVGKFSVPQSYLGHSPDRTEMLAYRIRSLCKRRSRPFPLAELKIAFAQTRQQPAVVSRSPFGKTHHSRSLSFQTRVALASRKELDTACKIEQQPRIIRADARGPSKRLEGLQ